MYKNKVVPLSSSFPSTLVEYLQKGLEFTLKYGIWNTISQQKAGYVVIKFMSPYVSAYCLMWALHSDNAQILGLH